MYLFVPDGSTKGETGPAAGNFYETENEYMILVYHRPFGGRYDKLVGLSSYQIRLLASINNINRKPLFSTNNSRT